MKAVRRWQPGLSEDFLQFAVPTVVTKTNTGVVRRAPAPDYSVEVFLGDKSTRQSLKF